jgi:hypothetical protein
MDMQLALIWGLTFVIHLIGTLSYSVRIAGVRTGRIAVSFALFNILVLVSRTANGFQAPLLAKRVETHLGSPSLLSDFRWLLLAGSVATVVGALLIPTFQRVFSRAVLHFQKHRSIPRLLLHALFRGGVAHIKDVVAIPAAGNLKLLNGRSSVAPGILLLNVAVTALWTVGIFAALFAGNLNHELRGTSSNLSSLINGLATIFMFIFIDPNLSVMTDDVVDGRMSEPSFRRAVIWLVGSRLAGTLLAQALLLPASWLIVWAAERI